jgi:hypothetical protein
VGVGVAGGGVFAMMAAVTSSLCAHDLLMLCPLRSLILPDYREQKLHNAQKNHQHLLRHCHRLCLFLVSLHPHAGTPFASQPRQSIAPQCSQTEWI